MSPEQAAGRSDLSEATDIYSLACVVFEMLIGEPPGMWVTEEAGRLGNFIDAPPKQRLKLDALPGSLESTLVHAMRLRPDERYATAIEFAEALEAALSAPKVYDELEAQSIVRRAADLEAREGRRRDARPSPAPGDALSLGGVERMGAEVGIAPELVRAAARSEVSVASAHAEPSPEGVEIEKGGFFGYTGKLKLDETIDVEVSDVTYGILLEEIRDIVGRHGQINETLSQSLSWETGRGLFKKAPRLKVHVSPYRGRTRFKITQLPGLDRRMLTTAVIAGGSILGMAVFGGFARAGAEGFGAIMGLGTLPAVYGSARAWFRARVRRKSRSLTRLLGRLTDLVRDYDAPALPGRRSRTTEENDARRVER
jgi:hypothetical protein